MGPPPPPLRPRPVVKPKLVTAERVDRAAPHPKTADWEPPQLQVVNETGQQSGKSVEPTATGDVTMMPDSNSNSMEVVDEEQVGEAEEEWKEDEEEVLVVDGDN